MRGSMHELSKQFLRPSSPSGSQKSSRYKQMEVICFFSNIKSTHNVFLYILSHKILPLRSKNSTRSKKSNKSNTSTRRSKNRRTKERARTESGSNSRNASRTSKKHRDRSSSEDTDNFFTGESDEEFVSISSNSDKAPRVSWTCEHCTYVNNPGVKVCAMCYKTSKLSREGGKRSEEHSKGRSKSHGKSRKDFSSEEDSDNNKRKSKSRGKKDYRSEEESEEERRRGKGKNGKNSKSSKSYKSTKPVSEDSEEDEAVAAYYAVRIDKTQGMTVTQQAGSDNGRYDSSSESVSASLSQNRVKRPNIEAPAPAKGILKKVASNPSLAKLDGMSEMSGAISEVGYITNKLNQRLKARGQRDILEPVEVKQRLESSSEDIWQQERENWARQKEELKAWAMAQAQASEGSPKVIITDKPFSFRHPVDSCSQRTNKTVSSDDERQGAGPHVRGDGGPRPGEDVQDNVRLLSGRPRGSAQQLWPERIRTSRAGGGSRREEKLPV